MKNNQIIEELVAPLNKTVFELFLLKNKELNVEILKELKWCNAQGEVKSVLTFIQEISKNKEYFLNWILFITGYNNKNTYNDTKIDNNQVRRLLQKEVAHELLEEENKKDNLCQGLHHKDWMKILSLIDIKTLKGNNNNNKCSVEVIM